MHSASLLSVAALSAAAQAASFTVKVGQGGNVFEPSTVTAQVGDQVEFQWVGSIHSIVQSTFDEPCQPLAGGFAVPDQSSSDVTFTFTVTSTDPIWFYCAVRPLNLPVHSWNNLD
jgi:plastocyanin